MLGMGLTMSLRMMGPVEWLTNELESATSTHRRARLIRKLALSHEPRVIETIVPYLAAEGRERAAAVQAILHFGEDARAPVLAILADATRRDLHPGALRVLAGIVRASTAVRVRREPGSG